MNAMRLDRYEKLERIMRAMPPELRLAGMPPEQIVLALPDDLLRASLVALSRLWPMGSRGTAAAPAHEPKIALDSGEENWIVDRV